MLAFSWFGEIFLVFVLVLLLLIDDIFGSASACGIVGGGEMKGIHGRKKGYMLYFFSCLQRNWTSWGSQKCLQSTTSLLWADCLFGLTWSAWFSLS